MLLKSTVSYGVLYTKCFDIDVYLMTIYIFISETQLHIKIYFSWSYKSRLISEIQSKWRMVSKFLWVCILLFY